MFGASRAFDQPDPHRPGAALCAGALRAAAGRAEWRSTDAAPAGAVVRALSDNVSSTTSARFSTVSDPVVLYMSMQTPRQRLSVFLQRSTAGHPPAGWPAASDIAACFTATGDFADCANIQPGDDIRYLIGT